MDYRPKPLFKERIEKLLTDRNDIKKFWIFSKKPLLRTIRCNTLKISPQELKKRLEKKWKIKQPFPEYPEIMQVASNLLPGELGKSREHILGYYYIQETASMMPILALKPSSQDILVDLCAAPGSKTTHACAVMENKGTIIANDVNLGRISILSSNLEKQGCSNVIITRHDGIVLCNKLKKLKFQASKILADVPCSGEGNIRSNLATLKMWNIKVINKLSRIQKKLASSALEILRPGGEMLYSTCTHAPEENELIIQHLLNNFNIKIEPITLPLKTRPGITEWEGQILSKELNRACRIYPQDNDTEGFFLCKIKKLE